MRLCLYLKAVAYAGFGKDILGADGVRLNLAAQVADVDL